MPQVAPCPHCNTQLALPAEATTGRSVRCPACAEAFGVEPERVQKLPTASLLPLEPKKPAPAPSGFRLPPLGLSETNSADEGSTSTGDENATIVGGPGLADLLRRSEQATGDAEKEVAPTVVDDAPVGKPPRDPALSSLLDQLRGVGPMPEELDKPPQATSTTASNTYEPPAEEAAPVGLNLEASGPLSRDFDVEIGDVEIGDVEIGGSAAIEEEAIAEESSFDSSPPFQEEALVPAPRRGWGVGRLATVAAGGLLGVGLGYGLLTYLGGPAYDSLGLLGFATASSASAADDAAPPEPSGFETPFEAEAMPATFESPSDAPADDLTPPPPASFGSSSAFEPPAAELDSFEPQADEQIVPAVAESPVAESPVVAEPAAPFADEIAVAPEPTGPTIFGYDELNGALAGAGEAKGELIGLWLDQGQLEAVGRAYAKLCEVAHVLTYLADDSTHPDMMLARLEAQDLFQQLFRYGHTRSDCSLVAERWLSWSERPHGGVFFAGTPASMRKEGSVFEYRFSLPDGGEVVVLSEESLAGTRFAGAELAGVIGTLVDAPARMVEGYTGGADQAVLAAHVFPVFKAEFE